MKINWKQTFNVNEINLEGICILKCITGLFSFTPKKHIIAKR